MYCAKAHLTRYARNSTDTTNCSILLCIRINLRPAWHKCKFLWRTRNWFCSTIRIAAEWNVVSIFHSVSFHFFINSEFRLFPFVFFTSFSSWSMHLLCHCFFHFQLIVQFKELTIWQMIVSYDFCYFSIKNIYYCIFDLAVILVTASFYDRSYNYRKF